MTTIRQKAGEWARAAFPTNATAQLAATEGYLAGARAMRDEAAMAAERVQPKYPQIGHQYVCGNNDAKYDASAAIRALLPDEEPVK
jgi:hypothetical protein